MVRDLSSSTCLTTVAVILWGLSLTQIGMTFHNGFRLQGVKILLVGWQGLLQGDFAWFANPLVAIALILLYLNEGPSWLPGLISLLAFFCALDTFWFDALTLNENGNVTPVYGFGWGAVLWFSAIATAIAAAGTYRKERLVLARKFTGVAELFRWLGVALLIVIVTTSVRLYLLDRRHASQAERQYLKDVAFRRGPACTVEPEPVVHPLTSFTGPLEVIANSKVTWEWRSNPLMLLDWGIPMVRIGDRDYRREMRAGEQVVISEPRQRHGASAATLSINGSQASSGDVHVLALREGNDGRLVFHRKWYREVQGGRYCPSFDPYGFAAEPPRSLLQEALGLPVADHKSIPTQRTRSPSRITATVISRGDIPKTRQEVPSTKHTLEDFRRSLSRNCPDNVGWANRESDERQYVRFSSNMPFVIDDVAYYAPYEFVNERAALCIGEDIYTFKSKARSKVIYLDLGKRKLADFRSVWEAQIKIEDPILNTDDWNVFDVKQDDKDLIVDLYNNRTGGNVIIRAPWSGLEANNY